MKIAIFHMGFIYSGGGERTVINEALELQERGHHVTVFAPVIIPERCFPDLLGKINVKGYLPETPVPIPMREAISMIASSILSPAFAYQFKDYDVFICHSQPSAWIGYVLHSFLKKPYICYLYQPNRFLYPRPIDDQAGWRTNPSLRFLNTLVGKVGKRFIQPLDTISITEADAVLTVSRWIGKQIEQVYGKRPIICYPCVDSVFFRQTPKDVDSQSDPFILSTGRHYPQKKLNWLIEMMPLILPKCPSARLAITGAFTNYTSTLMGLCKKLKIKDRVSFTGAVSETELASLYSMADVYALTSPEEDLGLGPLEAGACGSPSVVWDHAGPRETVLDGVTGYRAKPYNLNEFAQKITKILLNKNLRRKLGSNARVYALRNFTWNKHVDKLENVLASIG